MKDLKRKIHYWCSDTMRNKITGKGYVCAVIDTWNKQHTDHTAPGSCRPHRGMEGLCTGEENHI